MKTRKIIALVVLLASATGAQAQYSADYYHRVGDTVYTRSEIGYYAWWDFDLMISLRREFNFMNPPGILGWQPIVITPYFTTTPLKVVGIAESIYDRSLYGASLPEYAYLFDNGTSGPVFLDSVQVHFQNGAPHRYLHLPYNWADYLALEDSCCVEAFDTWVCKLYESYFDTAVTVTDTFYVGWSNNNSSKRNLQIEVLYAAAKHTNFHPQCDDLDSFYYDPAGMHRGNCYFPWIDFYYCTDTNAIENPGGTHTWSLWLERGYPLLYPLIQIDTTVPPTFLCEPVQNFQATVLDTGSGCVFFTWDDFLHYTYCEVQYYAIQQGFPSAVDTVVEGANMLHLCGLDTMMTYYARIRAFCDTSKIETDWSNWVSFSFPHTDPPSPPDPPNPPQGVAEPSVLDQFTHVLPNPAADKVTVMSELGLRHIEIYNARGILVYSEPVGYSQASIDLRGWPAGQYMMLIETRQGKTAKRLVVAR